MFGSELARHMTFAKLAVPAHQSGSVPAEKEVELGLSVEPWAIKFDLRGKTLNCHKFLQARLPTSI